MTPIVAEAAGRPSISRVRIERVLSVLLAVLSLVFVAQALPLLVRQLPATHAVSLPVVVWFLGSIAWLVVASLLRRSEGAARMSVAVAYLAAVVVLPFTVIDVTPFSGQPTWLWYLCSIASAAVTFGRSVPVAVFYAVAAPVLYALSRVAIDPSPVTVGQGLLDVLFATLLDVVVVVIVVALRAAADAVDGAQASALERYESAVRQHAREIERSRVDALVHDSVLATLLAASRARSDDDRALAVRMATEAVDRLREAESSDPDEASALSLQELGERLSDAAGRMPGEVEVRTVGLDGQEMPVTAAEAVHSAAVQALVNSQQHAGDGVRRWIDVRAVDGGVEVVVGDEGEGFDRATVSAERLGLRVSIIERVAAAGGIADVRSRPGAGTRVRIVWPHGDAGAIDAGEEHTP